MNKRSVIMTMSMSTSRIKGCMEQPWQWCREGVVKYLLVFNPKAKRYSRASEARLVRQAARLLRGTVAVTYTTPQAERLGARYALADFARHCPHRHCVMAVGGERTGHIAVAALYCSRHA